MIRIQVQLTEEQVEATQSLATPTDRLAADPVR